jgi:hypothetical protein
MPFPTFAKKDEIPESMRDSYVERNGKWVADVEDTSGLKESQRKALDEKKKLEDDLKRVLGDRKLDDVAALLKKQQEDDEASARKAGDFDKLLAKRIDETKAEYEKRLKELEPYKAKYEDRELEAAIRDAAVAGGVIAEDMKHVIAITKGRRVKLDEKGKAIVLDADGDPTGLSVEKFFADSFKKEAPKFYQAAGGSGSGATGGGSGKVPTGTIPITDVAAIAKNADKIAKGEMKVAVPT